MARQTGAATKVALKVQTDINTLSVTNPYIQVPFYSTDFGAEQALDPVPLLGVAGTTNPRDPGPGQIGVNEVSGGWVVPIDNTYIGHWLMGLLGAPTTTGTGPYTHVFKSGKSISNQKYYSVEHQFIDVPRYAAFKSVMFDSVTIEWAASGLAQATFTGVAISETRSGSSGAGTLVAPTVSLYTQFHAQIKRNAVTLANCVGGSLTFSNNLDIVRSVSTGTGNIDGADPAIASCTGQLRMRYADETLITDAIAQTSVPLELSFYKDANTSLKFLINNSTFNRPKTAIPGPGGLEVPFDYVGYGTATEMLTVTLMNASAGTVYTAT